MQAGKLRHRIEFDEPVTSQSANGEEIVAFVSAFTVWGTVQPLNGNERLRAQQPLAAMDTRIRIRWSAQADRINQKWRAVHNGVQYNIVSVAHIDMARRMVELMALSGLTNG